MTNLNFMKMMREKFDIEDAIDIMLVSGFRVSFCWSGSQLSAVQHFTRWGLVIELFVNILCTFDFSPTFLHCGTQTLNQDWHLTHSAPIWNVIVSAAHDVCLSKRAPRQQQGKNLSFPKKRRKMGLEKNFSLNRDCCLQTSIFANPNLSKPPKITHSNDNNIRNNKKYILPWSSFHRNVCAACRCGTGAAKPHQAHRAPVRFT